ncbi:MAG: VWA domain-containing protein [Eubacterium sp.]|nr:VWA domain-containing protein [Eubacterium sp.]
MTIHPIISPVIIVPIALAILGIFLWFTLRRKKKISARVFEIARISAILVLVVVISLRPMVQDRNADVELKNVDVLFVVDTTISMWAGDYEYGNRRIDGAAAICESIMQKLKGCSFGLIRFDNQTKILAPFTQDTDNVEDAIETISILDSYYAKGSNLNTPYPDMEALLQSSAKKDKRTTIVFFLSDGEITDGTELMSYRDLEQYVNGGAVIGLGTEEGSRIEEPNSTRSYFYDYTEHADAVSHLDETTLTAIAADLDVDYIHALNTESVNVIVDAIRAGSSVTIEHSDRAVVYSDIYFYFVYPLAGLLILEAYLLIRKRRM